MTIEDLRELKEYFEQIVKYSEVHSQRSDEEEQVITLIDAEIASQSITDADVQKAIEVIDNLLNYIIVDVEDDFFGDILFDHDADDAIRLAITALRQMRGWISVEDRLPESANALSLWSSKTAEQGSVLWHVTALRDI